ncbi:MAG: DNA primase [Planctomycetota bacterium]
MARIPEHVIRSLQDSVDLVDIISRYVTLKRSGSAFKGLCPFHEEKTPSFTVFPQSGRYKCFGCGEGGDVFTFLMKRGNLGFREVLAELAREAGVTLPAEPADPDAAERARRRTEALDALRFAAGFYRTVLERAAGGAARAYLAERGFTEATLEAFGVGYAPDEFEAFSTYARRKGIPEAALTEAGLLRRSEQGQSYDMFRGRIMFPIHDLRGREIGFGARALGDPQPKYLNSPDGSLFHKGREMYGLHLAREAARGAGRLLVVEGYTDVMHCHQGGLREVAAGLGTALTAENARQLRRFGVPVFLVYDGDEAGQRAAERAAEVLLAERLEGSVALLPPGRDPADLVVREGPGALERALEAAQDLWSYRMERALGRHDLSRLPGREKALRELEAPLGRIADPIRVEMAFKLLSERIGVPESTLRNQIRAGTERPSRAPEGIRPPAAWARAEEDFLRAALEDDATWPRIERVYPPSEFRDPDLRAVAEAIGDLRQQGESVTRVALLGVLADRDGGVRALQALEPAEDARERVEQHLARLTDQRRLDTALAKSDLEAVLRARRETTR